MRTSSLTKLAASALAAAAIVPAAALAADIELDGAVSLTKASTHQANVVFQTESALPRGNGGIIDGSVRFDGGKFSIRTSSHEDNRYISTVKTSKDLAAGKRYAVRIVVDGETIAVKNLRLE